MLPIHRALCLVLAGFVLACGEEKKNPPPVEESAVTGDEHLANGRLYSAQKAYEEALAADPQHRHSAFGAALTSLLLLPDSAPVTSLLDTCGQPHLGVESKIFGPNGLLAQDARNRAGSATLQMQLSESGGSFTDLAFTPNRFRSSTSDDYVSISLYQVVPAGATRAPDLYLSFSSKDVYTDDSATTPLQDGMVLDVRRLGYNPSVYFERGYSSSALSGAILFRGGKNKGDAFTLDFQDVQLTACIDDAVGCTAKFRLHGTVKDSFNGDPVLNPLDLPFAAFRNEAGPPERSAFIAALEKCGSAVTTELLSEKAHALAQGLDRISERLTIAAGANPADFSFTIPRALLFVDRDVPVNGADLLALRGVTRSASAALKIVASYRYFDGPVTALIGEFDYWRGEPPTATRKRDFLYDLVATNLQTTLFTLSSSADFAGARSSLDGALADAVASLRLAPTQPGLLNFQSTQSQPFAQQLSEQLELARQSLTSADSIVLARNPLYALHLARFFDPAFDRARLLANSGLTELVTFHPGNPDAATASERNYSISFASPATLQELETWLGGIIRVPAQSSVTCTTNAQCPSSYSCNGSAESEGRCIEPWLVLVEPSVMDTVSSASGPAFFTPEFQSLERNFR